jgi:cytidylate kinase
MIITIDGTAGSGKTTTAKEVARRLGYLHVDSGAFYRAFAYAACRLGLASPAGVVPAMRVPQLAAQNVGAEIRDGSVVVTLDGRALDDELRTPEVSACASKVSAFPEIRERVDALLRRIAMEHGDGIVCEGRDMGTIVFPHAELKIFMKADPEVRARRRLLQRGERPTSQAVKQEARRLKARDKADSERTVSPLRIADDAVVIDTTRLSFEEQVQRVLDEVRRRGGPGAP